MTTLPDSGHDLCLARQTASKTNSISVKKAQRLREHGIVNLDASRRKSKKSRKLKTKQKVWKIKVQPRSQVSRFPACQYLAYQVLEALEVLHHLSYQAR